jgi:hypothetical protein
LTNASYRVRSSAEETIFSFNIASISRSTSLLSDCLGVVSGNQPLLVSPGSHVGIQVNRTTTVTMARFSNLNSRKHLFKEILRPGSYSISLAADDLGGSLRAKFDDPTAVMSCD